MCPIVFLGGISGGSVVGARVSRHCALGAWVSGGCVLKPGLEVVCVLAFSWEVFLDAVP